jgi:hypothetical protein
MGERKYSSLAEATKATARLGINSHTAYRNSYKKDPRLPSSPKVFYSHEWPLKNGWDIFLGKNSKITYQTLTDFNKAIKSLGIGSQREYLQRYKEDPKLPSGHLLSQEHCWSYH